MFLAPVEPSLSHRSLRKLRQWLVILSLGGAGILLLSFGLIQKTLYDSALEQGAAQLMRLVSSISITVSQADPDDLSAIPLDHQGVVVAVLDTSLVPVHGNLPVPIISDLNDALARIAPTDRGHGTLICQHGQQVVMASYHFMPVLDRVVVVMTPRNSLLGGWIQGLALQAGLMLIVLLVMGCLSVWLWRRLKQQYSHTTGLVGHVSDAENALSGFGCAVLGWRPGQDHLVLQLDWPAVLGSGLTSPPVTAKDFLALFDPQSLQDISDPLVRDIWPDPRFATMVCLQIGNGDWHRFYLSAIRGKDKNGPLVTVLLLQTTANQQICNPFEAYLTHTPDPAIAVDETGRLRGISPVLEQLVGLRNADLIDRPFLDLFVPEDRNSAAYAFADCLQGTKGGHALVFRIKDRDQNLRWLAWHCIGPYDGIMYASARDVSEFVQNASKLRDTLDQLKRSNEDLEQFAYVASHDLQEPLRMVASYTQLLKRRFGGTLDPEADEYIDYAVDGAKRMHKLITHLLEYARTGSNGDLTLLDCNEILNEAQADLKAAIQQEGATITHNALPKLQGDRIQLSRLFQNLIGNAIKYARPGVPPHIDITALRDPDMPEFWRFSVRDNGIGIHSDHASRIFRLFQRLHKDEFAGTGLGLSLCRKIVEQHGGTIWLDTTRPMSDPGATFIFTLRGDTT
ncbi:ATP-binding protein [Thalassospira sp.]|uniref:ATP-binding protein n=1 Tax=Thalassospira sp. TaxID=1912094 RepID=UPI00273559A2|nr:ATP-binding protein [Thalassospira sp.]MDP2699053.1 ATP-binding protein [Thalassospira sp.]